MSRRKVKQRTIMDWSGRKCYRSAVKRPSKIYRDKYCCALCRPEVGVHYGYNPARIRVNFFWSWFEREHDKKIVWRYSGYSSLKSLSTASVVHMRTKANWNKQYEPDDFVMV